jgi:hypothetical protein
MSAPKKPRKKRNALPDAGHALVDAAAAALLADEAKAVTARTIADVAPTVDFRKHLHAKQLEVAECDARVMSELGGRQAGKTFGGVGWSLEGGWAKPGSTNPYFALSKNSLRDIWWPEVVKWWGLLGWSADALHQNTYTAVLPNGSMLRGLGTDDRRTIEHVGRGQKYNRIVIDEMGAQPESYIEYFISMLWPTMIKNDGRMLRTGNPGLVLRGYWYDQTCESRSSGTPPLFRSTAWDNPALWEGRPEGPAYVDAFVEEYLQQQGLTRDSATYKREWLAIWVEDIGALVFPFEMFNERGEPGRNFIAALPSRTAAGIPLQSRLWSTVIAADVGIVDSCAFTVLKSHPALADDYIVSSEKHHEMTAVDFRVRLRELIRSWRPSRATRIDTGGMGKAYAVDCQRHGLSVIAAEKTEKRANVRLFRDRILAGSVKVIHEACIPLLDEAAALGWDTRRELPREGLPDDCVHSALYGWRDLHNYREYDRPTALGLDGPPAADVLEERVIAERLKKAATREPDHMASHRVSMAFLRR